MKLRLFDLATALMVGCALITTGLLLKREFTGGRSAGGEPVRLPNAAALATGSFLGRPDAPVKVVEFSDFQCPYCARVQPTLDALRAKYPDRVTVVFRHLPLESIHPHAMTAALATSCAEEQGRFEEFHDILFARQDSIGVTSWARFAALAEVPDANRFEVCLRDQRYAPRVRADMAAAERAGLTSTPSFVVNGKLLSGAAGLAEFEALLDE